MGSATSIIKLSLESNQYEQGLRGAKRQFEDFTASIGINMKKMTAYGLAAGAAAAAINSLTDTIGTAISEGTRMAKEMEGVRTAFDRLNKPGLLDNLREATHGTVNDLELMKQAVKFDNFNLSLDQMGTMLAFAQQQAKDTGQDVGYLVDSIVTGLGRKSLPILDNLGLSATDIRERMKETGDMTQAVAQIIQERMEAAGGYVETASDRAAKATAELENAMTRLGETLAPLTGESDSLWNSIQIGAINALNSGVAPLVPKIIELKNGISELYTAISENAVFKGLLNWMEAGIDATSRWIPLLNILRGLMKGNEAGAGASVGASIGKAISELSTPKSKVSLPVASVTTSGGATVGAKQQIPSIGDFNKQLGRSLLDSSIRDVQAMASPYQMMLPEIMKQILGVQSEDLSGAMARRGEQQVIEERRKKEREDSKKYKPESVAQSIGDITNGVGGILGGIEQMGIEIPDGLKSVVSGIQGVMTILTSINTILGVIEGLQSVGILPFFSHGGVVHAANGYIVPGNNYSGDMVPAMLNSGETVLTKAQSAMLAQNLQGNGRAIQVTGRVRGSDIVLSIDRELQQSGRGQLLTWG